MEIESDMEIKLDDCSSALAILEKHGFSYDGIALPHKNPHVQYTGVIRVEGENYPVAYIDPKILTLLNPHIPGFPVYHDLIRDVLKQRF